MLAEVSLPADPGVRARVLHLVGRRPEIQVPGTAELMNECHQLPRMPREIRSALTFWTTLLWTTAPP